MKNISKINKEIKNNAKKKFNSLKKQLDPKIEYNLKINKDNKTVTLFNNDVGVITGEFNFYGVIKPNGIFLWSYMISGVDKRFLPHIDRVKSLSHLFEKFEDKDSMLYHTFLTQDSIYLNDEERIKILELLLYLGEDMYFFVQPNLSGNLQLIYLTNTKQKRI